MSDHGSVLVSLPPPPPPPPRPLPLPRNGLPRPPPYVQLVLIMLRGGCDHLRDHLLPLLRVIRVGKSAKAVGPTEAAAKLKARENASSSARWNWIGGVGCTWPTNQNLGVVRALAHQFWFSSTNRRNSFFSFDNPQRAQLTTSTMAKSA
jgi:hypothetical protein